MSETKSLFGIPVQTSETLEENEMWMVNERGANAFKDYDEGTISKDERDAILGEELLTGQASLMRWNA